MGATSVKKIASYVILTNYLSLPHQNLKVPPRFSRLSLHHGYTLIKY